MYNNGKLFGFGRSHHITCPHLLQKVEIHFVRSHVKDHLVLEFNPLQNCSGIHSKVVVCITLTRVYSTLVRGEFHSKTRWSQIWLLTCLKEWISTPIRLDGNRFRSGLNHSFESGFHCPEHRFPLQINEVGPERVDFQSCTFREYITAFVEWFFHNKPFMRYIVLQNLSYNCVYHVYSYMTSLLGKRALHRTMALYLQRLS